MLRRTALSLTIMFCAALVSAAQNFNISPSLRRHVEYLCSEQLGGRKAGSEGEKAAAEYVYDCLEQAGAVMISGRDGQDFTMENPGGNIVSRNVVGVVQGYDPRLRNEYILVGAHLDNLGTLTTTVNGRQVNRIYPGADDNASGTALLIELARLVADNDFRFRRSILFVAFGASECGLAGSWYFANRAFDDMAQVKAMVNLDMLGRGNADNPFRLFSSLDKRRVNAILDKVQDEPVVSRPNLFGGTVQTSDHLPFYEKGIPVFLFTTGITHEYRTVNDTPDLILYPNMERIGNYIFWFLKTISENDISASKDDKAVRDDGGDPVYSQAVCDKRAQFFHSDESHFLSAWVYKYLKYPEEAVKDGIQGTVVVSFIVEKNGKVTNVEVAEGADPLLDEEAVRVVSVSPDWIPAKLKGKTVRSRVTVPVEFRLASKSTVGIKNWVRRKNK